MPETVYLSETGSKALLEIKRILPVPPSHSAIIEEALTQFLEKLRKK